MIFLESRKGKAARVLRVLSRVLVLRIENQRLESCPERERAPEPTGGSLKVFSEILISTRVGGNSPRWGKSHLKGTG